MEKLHFATSIIVLDPVERSVESHTCRKHKENKAGRGDKTKQKLVEIETARTA